MKIPMETVNRWKSMTDTYLAGHDLTREEVKRGADAWLVATQAGLTREAYRDRDIVDAHIQTALEKVFPNATFNDPKRY